MSTKAQASPWLPQFLLATTTTNSIDYYISGDTIIRFLIITGKKLSCEISAADPFVRKFQERTEELGLEATAGV
jgi:hypothetical protein